MLTTLHSFYILEEIEREHVRHPVCSNIEIFIKFTASFDPLLTINMVLCSLIEVTAWLSGFNHVTLRFYTFKSHAAQTHIQFWCVGGNISFTLSSP